jgi:xanthine/uracil permease
MSLRSLLRLPAVHVNRRPADLMYAANERPPVGTLLGLAAQHTATALAFVAYVLVTARIANLPQDATQSLVTATVLGMAIATVLQAYGGRLGAGALIVHLPDPIVMIAAASVIALHGGGALAAIGLANGVAGLLVGQAIPRLRAFFPPTIAGVVVCVTGISLIVPAFRHATGFTPANAASGARPIIDGIDILISCTTLAVIVALSVWGSRRTKLFALLAGLLAGVVLTGMLGRLTGAELLEKAAFFGLPSVPVPELHIDPAILVAIVLLAIMVQLDTLGTVVLMSKMDDADWRRADMRRVSGGIRAGSISNILTGFLGGLPSGTSSANIALCHISRSTSRYAGLVAGGLLALVAFLPKSTVALTLIPTPVVGAVETYAAAYLIVSGIELIASRAMDARGTFMVGLSMVAGIGTILLPDVAERAPASLRILAESGVVVAGVVAILLNLLFRLGVSRRDEQKLVPLPETPSGKPMDLGTAIVTFVETSGARWGARRDAVQRAAEAALEAAEAIAASGGDRTVNAIRGSFDEYNLDIELAYTGEPLQLGAATPASPSLLDTSDEEFQAELDRALRGVSAVLLRRLADRVVTGKRDGRAFLRLHFDH